jgi:RNA polymerase sigma-70 factor (ECF subfamily)
MVTSAEASLKMPIAEDAEIAEVRREKTKLITQSHFRFAVTFSPIPGNDKQEITEPPPWFSPTTGFLQQREAPLTTTDPEIMAQLQAGKPEGLALLFDRHSGPLLGYFYRLTGGHHTSEDLVQEVFLRIMKYSASFRPGLPFKPWFYQIARRVHLDQLHGQEVAVPDLDLRPSPVANPHLQFERRQDQERLDRALAALPRDKRELLLLSRDPDLNYQDLAELFGCSPAAIKVRVHRAMLDLRAQFLPGGQ